MYFQGSLGNFLLIKCGILFGEKIEFRTPVKFLANSFLL